MTRPEFEQLYERTRGKAVAAAARAVGNQEMAEDAVQEAALYILARIDLNVGREFTESYFIQLATSRAKDQLKKAKKYGAKRDRPHPEIPLGSALDLDHALYGPDAE